MANDWLDKRFENKARRERQREIAGEHTEHAAAFTPVIFRSLCNRIREDIERYKTRSGDSAVELSEAGGILAVHRGRLPAFHLEFRRAAGPDITIAGYRKESLSAWDEDLSGVVSVVAGDEPDQCWMNYRGTDYGSVGQLSEDILSPVLDPLLR